MTFSWKWAPIFRHRFVTVSRIVFGSWILVSIDRAIFIAYWVKLNRNIWNRMVFFCGWYCCCWLVLLLETRTAKYNFNLQHFFFGFQHHVETELEWHRTTCVNVWMIMQSNISKVKNFKPSMNRSIKSHKNWSLPDTNRHPTRKLKFFYQFFHQQQQQPPHHHDQSNECTSYAFTISQHHVPSCYYRLTTCYLLFAIRCAIFFIFGLFFSFTEYFSENKYWRTF